jgi:hypothetical protein
MVSFENHPIYPASGGKGLSQGISKESVSVFIITPK